MFTLDTTEHLIRALASFTDDPGELKAHSYDDLNAAVALRGSCVEYGSPDVERWVIRAALGIAEPIDAIRVLRDHIPESELDAVDPEWVLESRQTFLDYASRDDISTHLLRLVLRARLGCSLTRPGLRWLANQLLQRIICEDELEAVSEEKLLLSIQAYLAYQAESYWSSQFVCEIMRVRLGLEATDDFIRHMAHRLIGGLALSVRLDRLSVSQVREALIVKFESEHRRLSARQLVGLIETRLFEQPTDEAQAALWPEKQRRKFAIWPAHKRGGPIACLKLKRLSSRNFFVVELRRGTRAINFASPSHSVSCLRSRFLLLE